MKGIKVSKPNEPCTGCGDVIELLTFQKKEARNYTLYKTLNIGIDRSEFGWVYFLMMEDDKFPIVITEECAQQILIDPQRGEKLAYDRWFDRYR